MLFCYYLGLIQLLWSYTNNYFLLWLFAWASFNQLFDIWCVCGFNGSRGCLSFNWGYCPRGASTNCPWNNLARCSSSWAGSVALLPVEISLILVGPLAVLLAIRITEASAGPVTVLWAAGSAVPRWCPLIFSMSVETLVVLLYPRDLHSWKSRAQEGRANGRRA